MAKKVEAGSERPNIYAVCGTEDSLCAENRRFKAGMEKRDFDFIYEEWPGVHDWQLLNDALEKAMKA